jgi:hypothetical protein
MGDVVYMNKQKQGVSKYMDSGIYASDLVKGVDFEVASIIVMDDQFEAKSLGGFLGNKSKLLFQDIVGKPINTAKRLVKESKKGNQAIYETPLPKENVAFYKLKTDTVIDIDLATEIGLGFVTYKNEYMIYSPLLGEDPKDVVYEMVRLKMYFQLTHPEYIDTKFKESFSKNEDLLMSLIIIDMPKHINRLNEIFIGV